MLFYWPKLLYPYYKLLLFSLSLLSVYDMVLWAGVFGLIGCISLSLSLALPKFFNNNSNNDNSIGFKRINSIGCNRINSRDGQQCNYNYVMYFGITIT